MARGRTAASLVAAALLVGASAAAAQEPPLLRGAIVDEPATGANEQPVPDQLAAETRLTVLPEPQEEEEDQQPRRRRPPEPQPFAPLGLRTGGLTVYPSVEIGGVVTDNVRQTGRARKADVGLLVAPGLRIQSDWARHELSAAAAGERIFYAGESDFDVMEIDATARLRLDIRRTTDLTFTGDYSLIENSPSSAEVPDTAIGRRQDHYATLLAALQHRFGRLAATLAGGASWRVAGDVELSGGGVEDNSDRDYVEPTVRLRLAYQASPALAPFAEVAYAPRFHRRERDRSGVRRDSEGGYIRAGAVFAPSVLWSGEAALRYDVRDYEDPSLKTNRLLGFDANVVWRPTRLTTVTLAAESGLEETTVAGASGIRVHEASLEIVHALRENVTLSSRLAFDYSDYDGAAADEWTIDWRLGVAYALSRNAELVGRYDRIRFGSDAPANRFIENRLSAGVRFRL